MAARFPVKVSEYWRMAGVHFSRQSFTAVLQTSFFFKMRSISCSSCMDKWKASLVHKHAGTCMHAQNALNKCYTQSICNAWTEVHTGCILTAYGKPSAGWVARIVLTFTSSSSDKISSLRDAKVCFSSWSTVSLLGFSRSISFCRRVKLRAVEMSSLPTSGNSTGGYRDKTGFDLGRPLFGGVIGTSDAGLFRMFAERTLCTRSINFFSQEPCDKSAW